MAKKKITFEQSLENLENIVAKLESGEETLESTLKLYEEGLEASKNCKSILEHAKQKITVCETKDKLV
ncbi:MAG: exodeoxyribonuclease VII small subunit [Clostridia bacterium]|nr:exodeoxyribonuclease VII small subunit [Clostridia bacterium]